MTANIAIVCILKYSFYLEKNKPSIMSMIHHLKNYLLFAGVALMGCNGAASQSDQGNSGDWQSLFNGKDLQGWHQLNGKAKYTVENDEIVGTTVANTPNSFLCTDKEYGDFILELEYKVDSTMNSGIQIRSESTADYRNGRVHGYQVEIDPSDRAWSGGIYDEARRGWLYPLTYNPSAQKAFKQGDWNHYRIECIGHTIRTWVNGVPAASLVDDMTPRGFIALQVHAVHGPEDAGRQIRWRNIRIQTENLQSTPYPKDQYVVNLIPNTLSEQEKQNGVQLLWDGKTTAGWRGIYKKDFPDEGWKIEDGVLTVLPSNGKEEGFGGDIVTDKEYGAFALQFEFRLTEGANSGVKYFVKETYDTNGKSGIGLEYQLLDDARHPDAKLGRNGDRTIGSLYDLIPAPKDKIVEPIGEWNHARIVSQGNHVEFWLNGRKTVEFERGSPAFREAVELSKFKDIPNFGEWADGHILLQDHGNEVSFCNVKIRELPAK
jgi:hypothetical protein